MDEPVNLEQQLAAREVTFYAVAAPGVDPEKVRIAPKVRVIGWKLAGYERGDLIDTVAEVNKHIAALEKWMEAARDVLKRTLETPTAEKPEVVTSGKVYESHYIRTVRVDVDREKVKQHFGQERYVKEFCKEVEVLQLRIVPIPQTPGTEKDSAKT